MSKFYRLGAPLALAAAFLPGTFLAQSDFAAPDLELIGQCKENVLEALAVPDHVTDTTILESIGAQLQLDLCQQNIEVATLHFMEGMFSELYSDPVLDRLAAKPACDGCLAELQLYCGVWIEGPEAVAGAVVAYSHPEPDRANYAWVMRPWLDELGADLLAAPLGMAFSDARLLAARSVVEEMEEGFLDCVAIVDLDPLASSAGFFGAHIEDLHGRLLVTGLHSGSPADRSGLMPGDLIWNFEGSMPHTRADLDGAKPVSGQDGVSLGVIRNRREIVDVSVRPDNWPPVPRVRDIQLAEAIVEELGDTVRSHVDRWGAWICAPDAQTILCASDFYPRLRCHHNLEEPETLALQDVYRYQDALVRLHDMDREFDVAWLDIRPEPDGHYTFVGLNVEFELEAPPSQDRLEEIALTCAEQWARIDTFAFINGMDLPTQKLDESMLRAAWAMRGSGLGFDDLFNADLVEVEGEELALLLEALDLDLSPACTDGLCHGEIRGLWPSDTSYGGVGLMSVQLPSSDTLPAWRDVLVSFGNSPRGVVLDGTGLPIVEFFRGLPHEGAAIRDAAQALEYAYLFSSLISGAGGTFRLIASPYDLVLQIGTPGGAREEIEAAAAELLSGHPEVIQQPEFPGTWDIVLPMVYDGHIFRSHLRIQPDFGVLMLDDEPLSDQLALAKDVYLNGTRFRLRARP